MMKLQSLRVVLLFISTFVLVGILFSNDIHSFSFNVLSTLKNSACQEISQKLQFYGGDKKHHDTERFAWPIVPTPSSHEVTPPVKKFLVPNVVHVTWFYSKEKLTFRFHMFISLLSAYKNIQPSAIMFWYNNEPTGYWWSEILRRIPVIRMCHREAPTSIYGHKVSVPEHQSDIVRLEVLMKYGGIYMDLDMIILKSFDPLRVYELTMGRATSITLANGLMVSKPNASFLRIWHNNYKNI